MRNLFIITSILTAFLFSCHSNSTGTGEVANSSDQDSILKDTIKDISIHDEAPIDLKKDYTFKRRKSKYPQNYFRNPFDSAILLSGTFCELRGNHWHGGLDIRTGGGEGWEVKSVADGYVSRVKVSPYGYGKVLYITHPNGYTSVYGHLKQFKGAIANYVHDAQYAQRSFEVELYPKAGELKVVKGEIVALSGNTGGSGGPHLHFEIRDNGARAVNPILFGLDVKDYVKPSLRRVLIYKKDPQSLISNGEYPYKVYTTSRIRTPVKVQPGTYSFGMLARDYFTDMRYKLGINYCFLTANDKLLYKYEIERMNFDMGRYINTHIDPYLKSTTGLNWVRLFKEKYNPFPYYKQDHNGEIWLKQGDSIEMKLVIEDYVGLRDSVVWTMIGDSLGLNLRLADNYPYEKNPVIKASSGGSVTFGEWTISLPKGTFYHDFELKLREEAAKPKMLTKTLQMHYGYTPLHTYINVSRSIPENLRSYADKLCAVSFTSGGGAVYEGGTLKEGVLTFRTRSFGEYAIYYDETPPRITPLSVGKHFRFKVVDNLSGIKSYSCSIDDKWILMEYEPKASTMYGEIPNWIKPGAHELKIVVTDDRGNKSEVVRKINL